MTRGRQANEVFVGVQGEETARDVLAEALTRSWIDEPVVARRAELAPRSTPWAGRTPELPLAPPEVRDLLERYHGIARTLSDAELQRKLLTEQIGRSEVRRTELLGDLSAGEADRDRAKEVIQDHDGPLSRRLHRNELDMAQRRLRQADFAVGRAASELGEMDQRRPGLDRSLAEAQATLRDRPRLERERHGIGKLLQKDLAARGIGMAADPPGYSVERLGLRPQWGPGADLWDKAAARIDQHRVAFDLTDTSDLLGIARPWQDPTFAASHHEASAAWDRCARSLGRSREIEPSGLELGIGF